MDPVAPGWATPWLTRDGAFEQGGGGGGGGGGGSQQVLGPDGLRAVDALFEGVAAEFELLVSDRE